MQSKHEHSTVPAAAGSPAAQSFEARFGPLLCAGGIVSQPMQLYAFQSALNLEPAEMNVLVHVFNQRRDGGPWAWIAYGPIERAIGRSHATIYSWLRSIQRKGYIRIIPSMTARGRQGANRIDLSPLLAAVERLWTAQAQEKAKAELNLPPPMFDDGALAAVASPPDRRIYDRQRSVNSQTDSPQRSVNSQTDRPNASGIHRPIAVNGSGIPDPKKNKYVRRRRQNEKRQTGRGVAARPGEPDTESDRQLFADPGAAATTTGRELTEDGIAYMVEQYVAGLGDNDPRRTAIVCTTLWRTSGLEVHDFHNAMKQAAHATTAAAAARELANPAGYWQTSLTSCVEQRRVQRGLVEASA